MVPLASGTISRSLCLRIVPLIVGLEERKSLGLTVTKIAQTIIWADSASTGLNVFDITAGSGTIDFGNKRQGGC
jgi:hypothetical protein